MKKLFLILICLFSTMGYTQSVGAFIGGGIISANSPSISSAAATLFFETGELFKSKASVRFSFLYDTDIDQVLPSTTNKYYPFLKGATIKGISVQKNNDFYTEEGVGLLLLNDRMFSDVNEWDFGLVISVGVGLDLRKEKPDGFKIGIGTDYGFTFTNTYAKYFAVYFQSQYYF